MSINSLVAFTVPDLQIEEGCRLHAYPDPLSGGEPFTVGFGSTGPGIGPNTVWTQEEADTALTSRATGFAISLLSKFPWVNELCIERQSCLLDMCFNLGLHGLSEFTTFLGLVQVGKFTAAADDVLQTPWAKEVGHRAQRIADQMRTGVHVPY